MSVAATWSSGLLSELRADIASRELAALPSWAWEPKASSDKAGSLSAVGRGDFPGFALQKDSDEGVRHSFFAAHLFWKLNDSQVTELVVIAKGRSRYSWAWQTHRIDAGWSTAKLKQLEGWCPTAMIGPEGQLVLVDQS